MTAAVKPHRVLLRPTYPDFQGNVVFSGGKNLNDRWFEPYRRWRDKAAERGITLDTWDLHPWDTADVIVFCDLPARRRELTEVKRVAPQARLMLILIESPLGRPHCFRPENHADFEWIVTYNWRLCDERRYFRFFLPIGTAPPAASPPFAERRPLVMINTNRRLGPMGLFAFRQPGLTGLPGVGWAFSDWKVGLSGIWNQTQGELYSRRREMARLADAEFPGLLDVFGPGWSGERTGWFDRFHATRPFACARGPSGPKDVLLPRYRFGVAFENMVGDVGYISEKIFDTLAAGVVPIYYGDLRIAEHVDPECFIDAREFSSDRELMRFVRDCPEAEWLRRREAGQRYLASDSAKKFQSEAFSQRMVELLEMATATIR